jgi:NADH dehydrogenase FAD-containing subunit
MPTSKFLFPIADALKQYDSKLYSITHGKAISLDTFTYTVTLQVENSKLATQTIPYHALVIATGTRTASPLFSIGSGREGVEEALEDIHKSLQSAKAVVIAGGGPTGVETAVAKERVYKPNLTENQLVPIGQSKGVGAFRGWRLSSFIVWLFKGRHYLTSTVAVELYTGSKWKRRAEGTSLV